MGKTKRRTAKQVGRRNQAAATAARPKRAAAEAEHHKKTVRKATKRRKTRTQADNRPPSRRAVRLDSVEVTAEICRRFCDGELVSQIAEAIKSEYELPIKRETPYQRLAEAARLGLIRFTPPLATQLSARIKSRYGLLANVDVVHSPSSDHVAQRGADALLQVVRRCAYQKRRAATHLPEVHIGFSGGRTMRTLARSLAELLRDPPADLKASIVLHALVSGFDVYDPTTNPNAFFTYFLADPAIPLDVSCVGLHAPALVRPEQQEQLRKLTGIKEAYEAVNQIDIVVTSASWIDDEHGMLRRYLAEEGDRAKLKAAGCVGDMLCRPIGPTGEVCVPHALRAMTIAEFDYLTKFVEKGKSVLLVAGPCALCHAPKTEVVRTILGQPEQLITDLVVDSLCARELVPDPGLGRRTTANRITPGLE